MKSKELIELEDKALYEKLGSETEKLQQLKLTHAVSPLENPSQIKLARRDIARIKTEIKRRELSK